MDDRRVGLIIRALRRRRVWRQVDLADAADISQSEISRIERGHYDRLSLEAIRRVPAALDARAGLEVRWRGAEIDRLLDKRHAAIGSTIAAELTRIAWPILLPEVTFMRLANEARWTSSRPIRRCVRRPSSS